MWQALTIIAVFILGFQGYLAYENKAGLKRIIKEREDFQTEVTTYNGLIAKEVEKFEGFKAEKEQAIADNEKRTEQKAELQAEREKLVAEVDAATKERKEKEERLAEIEEQTKGLPDYDQLKVKLNNLNKQITGLNSEISDLESQLANLNEQRTQADQTVDDYETLERNRRQRISAENLTAKIAQSYQNFGFVIIGGGYNDGVVPDSEIEVVRDEEVIAKLRVTSVEANKAAADIIGETLAEGTVLRPGDKLRSVRPVEPEKVTPQDAPPAPGDAAEPGEDAPAEEEEDEFDFDLDI